VLSFDLQQPGDRVPQGIYLLLGSSCHFLQFVDSIGRVARRWGCGVLNFWGFGRGLFCFNNFGNDAPSCCKLIHMKECSWIEGLVRRLIAIRGEDPFHLCGFLYSKIRNITTEEDLPDYGFGDHQCSVDMNGKGVGFCC
jgi:hypothetical protein